MSATQPLPPDLAHAQDMLDQREIDCHTLASQVAELCGVLAMDLWTRQSADVQQVRGRIQQVRRDLAHHVRQIESPGGLFKCISARCPNLERHVRLLTGEHRDLDQRLAELETYLADFDPADPREHTRVRQAATRFVDATRIHQGHGDRVVLDAWCTDLGHSG